MNLIESPIYKYLIQVRSWVNNFRDSYDIYHLTSGYYRALTVPNINLDFEQKWLYDFFYFIEEELKNRYSEKNLGGHWGCMLLDASESNQLGSIELFYQLLSEFEERYKPIIVDGKIRSNIQRYNF